MPDLTPAEQSIVSQLISRLLDGLANKEQEALKELEAAKAAQQVAASASRKTSTGEETVADCAKHLDALQAHLRRYGAAALGVRQQADILAVLDGRTKPDARQVAAWLEAVNNLVADVEWQLGNRWNNLQADANEKRWLARIPIDTPKIETLIRYEAHLRRAIERDCAALEAIREAREQPDAGDR